MPVTTLNTLWSILMGNMPLGQWMPIQALYEIVEANFGENFTPEDLNPVTPTNNEPTWHRNLRSVFQNKRATGDLLYGENENYRIDRPTVWRMVKEAANNLGGEITYRQIKDYINEHWENVNPDTITAQIIVLSVNHESRIHYPENFQPRLTNSKSSYDLLFKISRGRVVKYNHDVHGVWEIYLNEQDEPLIRQFNDIHERILYTPSDILWIKNVTNTEIGEAYMNVEGNVFNLNFPTIHQTNAGSPRVNELILLHQRLNGTHSFTHIVTPIDNIVREVQDRPDYRYVRRVNILAKTSVDDFIPVSTTLWNRVNFQGISQGNACQIDNITNIGNVDELRLNIWQLFSDFFLPTEMISVVATAALINDVEIVNPNLTINEGELKLVSHMARERNRVIIASKKRQAIENDTLFCEVCDFSFIQRFQQEFIECHHIVPIAQTGARETTLEDLALVCPNCHRMLHTKFEGNYLTIAELRARINQA